MFIGKHAGFKQHQNKFKDKECNFFLDFMHFIHSRKIPFLLSAMYISFRQGPFSPVLPLLYFHSFKYLPELTQFQVFGVKEHEQRENENGSIKSCFSAALVRK